MTALLSAMVSSGGPGADEAVLCVASGSHTTDVARARATELRELGDEVWRRLEHYPSMLPSLERLVKLEASTTGRSCKLGSLRLELPPEMRVSADAVAPWSLSCHARALAAVPPRAVELLTSLGPGPWSYCRLPFRATRSTCLLLLHRPAAFLGAWESGLHEIAFHTGKILDSALKERESLKATSDRQRSRLELVVPVASPGSDPAKQPNADCQ